MMPQGGTLVTILFICCASSRSAISQQISTVSSLERVSPLREVDRNFLAFLSGQDLSQFNGVENTISGLDDDIKSRLLEEKLDDSVITNVLFNASWRFVDLSTLKNKVELNPQLIAALLNEPLDRISAARLIEASKVWGMDGLKMLKTMGVPVSNSTAKKLVYQALVNPTVSSLPVDTNVKISLLRPVEYFEETSPLIIVLRDSGNLDDQIWYDIPLTNKKIWYESTKKIQGMTVAKMSSDNFLRPLISGATDRDILKGWFNSWDEEKYNSTLTFLKSTFKQLRPSQVQLLMTPFIDNIKSFASIETLLKKLDVSQIKGINWSDLPTKVNVDKTKLLLIATQSGFDFDTFNPFNDPSMLGLLFPLELQVAVDKNNFTINATALKLASNFSLSKGQSAVMLNGFFKDLLLKNKSASVENVVKIPDGLWHALPLEFIKSLDVESEEIMEKLERLMDKNYDKLLPSQKLGVFWKYSQAHKDLEMAGFGDIIDDNLEFKQDGQKLSASTLLNFISPAVYKATSSKDEEIKRMCFDLSISPLEVIDYMAKYNDFLVDKDDGKIKILSLSVRNCFRILLEQYLAIKDSIYQENEKKILTFAEQILIEGQFLTILLPDTIFSDQYKDSRLEIIRTIGQVPIPKLLPLVTFENLENVAKRLVADLGFVDDLINLSKLGSFAFFVGDQVGNTKVSDMRLFLSTLEGSSKCPCLPENHRKAWSRIIIKVYGSPESLAFSDMIELGGLVTLLDEDDVKKINKEAVRRSAPYLIKNSCLPKVYDLFPGYSSESTFEKVCQMRTNSSMSFDAFKRILLEATFTNLDIVFERARNPDDVGSVEVTVPTVVVNADDVKEEKRRFFSLVPSMMRERYTKGELSVKQKLEWRKLQNEQSNLITGVISSTLKIPQEDVPKNLGGVFKYIQNNNASIPDIKIQVLSSEINEHNANYIKKLAQLMKLTEEDLGISRVAFCNITACPEGENTRAPKPPKFDPTFDIAQYNATKDIPRSNISLCYGLAFAGFAGSAITVEDLKMWPKWELLKCLETLGNLAIDEQSKMNIWKVLYEKIGDSIMVTNGRIQRGAMIFIGSLISAVAKDAPEKLEYEKAVAIEPLSELGTMDLDQDIFSTVATEFVKARNVDVQSTMTTENVLEFISLGNLFCGLPIGIAKKVLDEAKKQQIPIKLFGAVMTSCKNKRMLAVMASRVEKPVKDWTSTDVTVYGIILAGMSPESLKKLDPQLFKKISPATFSHLNSRQFSSFSVDQISNFSLEAVSMLTMKQLSLNKSFRLTRFQVSSFPRGSPGDAVIDQYSTVLDKVVKGTLDPDSPEGKLLNFAEMDNDDKDMVLRPIIDRADQVLPKPEIKNRGDGKSSSTRTVPVLIVYIMILLVYLYLLFCCLE